jgi:steroid 5-alpha reductase family enzyme
MWGKEVSESSVQKQRNSGRAVILQAYLVALLVAAVIGLLFRDRHPLLCLAYADIAGTLTIFAFSFLLNNTSMYDPYWSVAPPFLLLGWWALTGAQDVSTSRMILVFALVSLWSLRLTTNFLKGWPGLHHEDWRYVRFRSVGTTGYWLISFFGLHFFPTVLVFVGSLSLYAVSTSNAPLSTLDWIAAFVTFVAIAIEYISDEQLRSFVSRNKNPQAFLKTGLWRWSRHPNYFGECLFWVGCYLFALSAAPQLRWTLWGPVLMFLLFAFVSIPMLDRRMLRKRPEYATHMKHVSGLFFWPVKQEPPA